MAVSGGPDSLALLLLAHAAMPTRIAVASVDHGLRDASGQEARFVADLCDKLSVPHKVLAVRVSKGNLQAQAREARYAALLKWTKRNDVSALATAHHADDQAETLLMRLNRGSGLAGLAGVRAQSFVPHSDVPLLRPLLGWRKNDLEAVVAGAGIVPIRDPSNDDTNFDRVRMRQNLARSDWIDPVGLAQSAAHLAQAQALIEHYTDEEFDGNVTREGGAVHYTPTAPQLVTVETILRIFAVLKAEISRSEAARLIARLETGRNASLAGILARPEQSGSKAQWSFAPEPSRRTG